MNIVVCVKQVPDTAVERTLTPEGTLDRASLDGLINELDEYAIEEGLKIAEAHGGMVKSSSGIAPAPNIGKQGLLGPYSRSKYASLQVTLRKALSNGLTFSSAFTWARDSGVGSGDLLLQGQPQDIYNRLADWGPAVNDVNQRSVTTAMYELPITRWMGKSGRVSNLLLGGWSVSGVFAAQTGLPANITNNLSANSTDRPNACGCGVPTYLGGFQSGPAHQYLNTIASGAFIVPTLAKASGEQGAPGNLSFDAVRSPGSVNVDFTLSKAFALTERFRLRVRADTFNTLNHTNLYGLVVTTGSANFGQLTQANSRTMQLTARLNF